MGVLPFFRLFDRGAPDFNEPHFEREGTDLAPGIIDTDKKSATVHGLESIADFFAVGRKRPQVSNTTALEVPAVFCAVRVISEGVSSMPVELKKRQYTKNGKVKTVIVRKHWAERLMSRRPNSWQTPAEFIEGMTLCAALTGQAIAVKNSVRGEVRELLPVPPGCWSVEQDANYRLKYRVNYSDKENDEFDQDQIFILRGPTLNGYEGLPAVKLAASAIGLSASLADQQYLLSSNGGQPSGILTGPAGELKPEVRTRIATVWKKKFGPGGEGGTAVLDNGWDYKTMAMSSVDSQVLESRRFQIEEIARAYRVLPLMIMQADKASTFASVEQMSRMHVTHTLMPWVNRWEQSLARDVLGAFEDLFFDFDETLLLRGDHKDQAEFFQKALGSGGTPGFMSVNEVREQMGLAPHEEDWADEIPQGSQSANLTENNSGEAQQNDSSPLQEKPVNTEESIDGI